MKRLWIVIIAAVAAGVVALGGVVFLPSIGRTGLEPVTCASLSVLSGEVEVMKSGTTSWVKAADGMTICASDRVKTGDGSSALLTLPDGSTMEIEPGTDVTAKELQADEKSRSVSFKQQVGKTWNRTEKLVGSSSRYEVETPAGVAMVRGTLFLLTVESNGKTTSKVSKEVVDFITGSVQTSIAAGSETSVTVGQLPPTAVASPPPKSRLHLSIAGGASIALVDSMDRMAGFVNTSVEINQIPGATTDMNSQGQDIDIPEPIPGSYRIVLSAARDENIRLVAYASTTKERVFILVKETSVKQLQDYIATLQIRGQEGIITAGNLGELAPLVGSRPGKFLLMKNVLGKSFDYKWDAFRQNIKELSDAGIRKTVEVVLTEQETSVKLAQLARQGYRFADVEYVTMQFSRGLVHMSGRIKVGILPFSFAATIEPVTEGSRLYARVTKLDLGYLPVPPFVAEQVMKVISPDIYDFQKWPFGLKSGEVGEGWVKLTGETIPK